MNHEPHEVFIGGTASTPSAVSSATPEDGRGGTRPSRKHPAHMPVVEAPNRAMLIFLTVCTKNRQPLLASACLHELLCAECRLSDRWLVGRYVVMPEHIHLFCAPGQYPASNVIAWAEFWKGMIARALKGHGPLGTFGGTASAPSTMPEAYPEPFWQRDVWDTQLRHGDKYSEKWEYVRHNPVRAGLAATPDEWPYQGELNVLMWHD